MSKICPKCNRSLIEKSGKYGKFLACMGFPSCRYTESIRYVKPETVIPAIKRDDFKPSVYQNAIFQAVEHDADNLMIEAVAGSGKTTTILKALEHVNPALTVAFVAFNRTIAESIKARCTVSTAHISTLHSLGLSNIKAVYSKIKIDNDKTNNILKYYRDNIYTGEKDEFKPYFNIAIRLVSLLKDSLLSCEKGGVESLCEYYNIELNGDSDLVYQAVEYTYNESLKDNKNIDFSDMIFLPASGRVPCKKFDVLMIDESQDLNPAQIKFILNTGKRIIAVGDRAQSIYGFRAADCNAIPNLIESLKASILPLSISYRCPRAIVELVNSEFPAIPFESAENAKQGTIEDTTESAMINMVKDGDLVICRNNAPLIKPCYTLLAKGIKASIRGRDNVTELQNLIFKIAKIFKSESLVDLLESIETYRDKETQKLNACNKSMLADSLNDKLDSIVALSDGVYTIDDLYKKIDSIFSDTETSGVIFSSIHRAKGDESNRVYILRPELMPNKHAKKEWELTQENNIKYVAYTRSKESLYFVIGD